MIEALFYALLCGFALSAILVPSTALALPRSRRLGATARHLVWFMVLAATFAATCAAFIVSALRPAEQASGTAIPSTLPALHAVQASGLPFVLCSALLVGWFVVSVALLLRIVRRLGALRAMKQRATPMEAGCDLPRGARALASSVRVPSAVGFLHPAILLPAGTFAAFDPMDAHRIVLHEAAHLRRRDDLTGLFSLVCSALLWFNPFVHYIGKRLSLECEIACDSYVVEQTGDAQRYATLLFEVALSAAGSASPFACSRFAQGSSLTIRIRNLVSHKTVEQRRLPRAALVALIGIFLSSVGLAAFEAPAFGEAKAAAAVYVRPIVGNFAAQDRRTLEWQQRVREFPPCNVQRGTGSEAVARMRNDSKVCEDRVMQLAPLNVRVEKGAGGL